MKIKTLFMTFFCAGLVLTLVLYLCHLYGNYIEKLIIFFLKEITYL